jgi:malate synthase
LDSFEAVIADLMPKNQALLAKRDAIQVKIDEWHRANPKLDFTAYKAFLTEIGYLVARRRRLLALIHKMSMTKLRASQALN